MSATQRRTKRHRAIALQQINRIINAVADLRRMVKRGGFDLQIKADGTVIFADETYIGDNLHEMAVELAELQDESGRES